MNTENLIKGFVANSKTKNNDARTLRNEENTCQQANRLLKIIITQKEKLGGFELEKFIPLGLKGVFVKSDPWPKVQIASWI